MTGNRASGARTNRTRVAHFFSHDAAADTPCSIEFKIESDGGAINRSAFIDSETNPLQFNGDTATAAVSAGHHLLVWAADGAVGQPFSFSLTGDVDKDRKGKGQMQPPDGMAGGGLAFVGVAP